jgi:hypothetical protein
MKADVVVMSFQLLKNKLYLQLGCTENHGPLGSFSLLHRHGGGGEVD